MPVAVGAEAPDFSVLRADGAPIGLADFGSHPLVLVFLRHLA